MLQQPTSFSKISSQGPALSNAFLPLAAPLTRAAATRTSDRSQSPLPQQSSGPMLSAAAHSSQFLSRLLCRCRDVIVTAGSDAVAGAHLRSLLPTVLRIALECPFAEVTNRACTPQHAAPAPLAPMSLLPHRVTLKRILIIFRSDRPFPPSSRTSSVRAHGLQLHLCSVSHVPCTGTLGTHLINRSPCISSFVHSNADFAPNFSSSGIDAAHLSQLLADVFVNNGRVSRLDVLLSCFPAVLESFVLLPPHISVIAS
jgi:hypothetical protein